MKTQLIFFDNNEESKKGLKRGSIAFCIILILLIVQNAIFTKYKYTYRLLLSYMVVSLLLCSAIGVQLPTNINEASIYSCLIGLVVFGIYYSMNYGLYNISFSKALGGIIIGIIITTISGSITYIIK